MRHAFILSTLVLAVMLGTARADDQPDPAAETAIHDVIGKQIEAFGKEDGAAAEAFAAPGVLQKFPTPESFMGMVRSAYGALIRPKSTHFDSLTQTALGLVQKVTIVDGNGQVWTAAYTMTLVDGQWRISGCYILKSEAVNA